MATKPYGLTAPKLQPRISFDPSGRYNEPHQGLAPRSANRSKYAKGGTPRGKVIPSTAYQPFPKAPSRRDLHRIEVSERL